MSTLGSKRPHNNENVEQNLQRFSVSQDEMSPTQTLISFRLTALYNFFLMFHQLICMIYVAVALDQNSMGGQ